MFKKYFRDKTILVTGASGSIGSEVVNFLLKYNCKVIRALSNDENGLHLLSQSINYEKNPNFNSHMYKKKIRYIYGDICDEEKCYEAMKGVDVVIHTAALKHLEICEYNPFDAVNVNVLGTKNLVKAAMAENISKFLFISTDKVVDSQSVLGSSKLLAEKIVLNANLVKGKKRTKFSSIRFGNVIGSRGSVLLTFIKQAKNNENITVSDQNMKRCFVTIQVAVEAILKSISIMKGAEIFLPKNIVTFNIVDLAGVIKKLYNSKSKVSFIGKKKGEKIEEKVLFDEEIEKVKIVKNIMIVQTKINKKSYKNELLKIYKIKNKQFIIKYVNDLLKYKFLLHKIIK